MTHKIKLRVTFLLVVLSLSACTKKLHRNPEDEITDESYWNNEEDLKNFANDFYPRLEVPGVAADEQSDNMVPNSPNSYLNNDVSVPDAGGGWSTDDWSYIRDANYFLSHYKQVDDDGSQDDINQYLGEILFFRAYEYFNKVKRFGDVPWINKALDIDNEDELFKERTPRKEVIDSVLSDLDSAIKILKDPDEVEEGRIHKYAALQMEARVALYEGTWMEYRDKDDWKSYLEKAVTASEKIMDDGGYEIFKPDAKYSFKEGDVVGEETTTEAEKDYPLYYREQFIQEDLSDNPECVLPKRYEDDVLENDLSRAVNESGIGVSRDFIESFLDVDGKPIALSDLYEGDDKPELEFKNRDPRLRNMIDNRYLPNDLDSNEPISNFLTPLNSDVPTGYMASKFRSPIPEQNEANQTTYDLYVFRYAEVLLINAEAKAELSTITQSDIDKTINKLRERLDDPNLPDGKMGRLKIDPPKDPNSTTRDGKPRYGYEVSPLIYEIRRERRIELAFEGFRWDDIVRWKAGELIENPKTVYGITKNSTIEEDYRDFFDSDVFDGVNTVDVTDWNDENKELVSPYGSFSRTWDDRLYLHPIPKNEISISEGNLEQNPGW